MDPIEAIIRNALHLRRLGNGLAREADALLSGLLLEIVERIARLDPTAVMRDRYRRERLDRLIREVEDMTDVRFAAVGKLLRQRLPAIGVAQSRFASSFLKDNADAKLLRGFRPGIVSAGRLRTLLDTEPVESELLRDWLDRQGSRTVALVRGQLRLGMATAEPLGQLVRRVRLVFPQSRRGTEVIVRTATTFMANEAAFETYRSNPRISSGYFWRSTLDARTSAICIALDGRRFRYDDPHARLPPAHANCRSTTIPDIKGVDLQRTSFEDWFRRQPAAKQDDILGSQRRGALFRSGRMSLRDLVRADGQFGHGSV